MNNNEKVTQILDQQIKEVQDSIIQNKVDIADVFISVDRAAFNSIRESKDILPIIKAMNTMPEHISKLKENEAKLDALTKSKTEIEKTYSEEYVK